MPGIEIKGRSKIANYRHGGRTGKQFGGPLTQPGVVQPGVVQPGVARPGVARPGVMPTRPLGLKDGGRTKKGNRLTKVSEAYENPYFGKKKPSGIKTRTWDVTKNYGLGKKKKKDYTNQ